MKAHSADAVIEVALTTASEDAPAELFVNRLRYRATEPNDQTVFSQWKAALDNLDFTERWAEHMPQGYYIKRMSFTMIHPTLDIHEDIEWTANDSPYQGSHGPIVVTLGYDPAICAVVTRKSYTPGRRGIGHVYFGPLMPDFVSSGFLNPEPAAVSPLTTLLDFLSDPLTVLGVTYNPCILPATPAGGAPFPPGVVTADRDVRANYFAAKVKQLESRRVGEN